MPLRPSWKSLILSGLAGLLCSCGGPGSAQVPEGFAGVSGRVIARDDAGMGDSEGTGALVALTRDKAAKMWALRTNDRPAPTPADLPYASGHFGSGVISGLASDSAELRGGRFDLTLRPAAYLICLADDASLANIQGCAEVDVASTRDIDFVIGEGGFRVRS